MHILYHHTPTGIYILHSYQHNAPHNHPAPSIDFSTDHLPFIRRITFYKPSPSLSFRYSNRSNSSRPLSRRCSCSQLRFSHRRIPPRPHQETEPLDPKSRSLRDDRTSLEIRSEEKEGFKAKEFSCKAKGNAGSM